MGKSAPSPPDPYKVADAQTQSNIQTAKEQQLLGMTGQTGPEGSLQYVADPSSPSGYRAVTEFSPELQALLQEAEGNQANFGSTVGEQLGRVNNQLGDNFNLDAARGQNISDIQKTFLDPQWNQQEQELETKLANQGIAPGSDEYEIAKRQFNQQKQDAYNQMYLSSYTTANNTALQNQLLPEEELGMLTSAGNGSPLPQMPPFQSTPSPGVAPTDVSGLVEQQYAQQVAQSNAKTGGLFGLGAAGLGGWAKAGFPGAASLLALA